MDSGSHQSLIALCPALVTQFICVALVIVFRYAGPSWSGKISHPLLDNSTTHMKVVSTPGIHPRILVDMRYVKTVVHRHPCFLTQLLRSSLYVESTIHPALY